MKKIKNYFLLGLLTASVVSCQKDQALEQEAAIAPEVIAQIKALGFGTSNIQKLEDGYLVEGDIVLTPEILQGANEQTLLRVANSEQYRTTNLVTGLPRNITISVSSTLPARYSTAVNDAISRYNAEGLRITFSRVPSRGEINVTAASSTAGYLASAGFPKGGKPYSSINVNSTYLDNNAWDLSSVTSIMAHEIGHCIGFRHTDYMDRSFSCGGAYSNEGASNVGAIHITGTPTTADPNSWMLACIGKNVNRPFNNNDVIALNYLY
jgi:hypothetical protein